MVRQLPAGSIASLSASHRGSVARWRLVSPLTSQQPTRSLASFASHGRPSLSIPSPSLLSSRQSRSFTASAGAHANGLFHPSVPRLYPRKHDVLKREEEQTEEGEEKENGGKERQDINKRPQSTPTEGEGRSPASVSSSSASAGASSSSDGGESSTPASSDNGDAPPSNNNNSISKRSVPEVYPQVLALPITRRPLFPGFYKAVVIRNPAVIAAIKESIARGQPYIGAFLLKDENADSDMWASSARSDSAV